MCTLRLHITLVAVCALLACAAAGGCASLTGGTGSAGAESQSPLPTSDFERKLVDQYFLEGSVLQMQEHYAEAISQYQLVLHLAPKHAAVRYALARCYQALGRNDTALTFAESALALTPGNVDARMQLADLLLANGRLARAVEQYEEVVRREPGNLQARYNVARLLQRIDPARSIVHYEYIRKYLGEDYNALLNLAELYMNQKNYDGVVDVMRELLVLDASNADLYRILSDAYQRAGHYDEAARLLGEVEQHVAPDSVFEDFMIEEVTRTAQSLAKDTSAGHRAYARIVAATAGSKFPKRWESGFYSGMIFYHLADSLAADSLIFKALANKAAPSTAWTEAASLYIDDGNSGRAVRVMAPTAARFRDDYHVPYLLGYAYSMLEKNDSAERYLRKSIALEEENSDAWEQLALVYNREGKLSGTENAYERAVEYESDDPTLLNNYAYFLAGRGRRLDYAMTMIDRALEKEPENESFLDTKGWIYFKLSDYRRALQYIQRSADIGGAGVDVLDHLGDTQHALGNIPAAREAYARALKLDPANEALKGKLEAVK